MYKEGIESDDSVFEAMLRLPHSGNKWDVINEGTPSIDGFHSQETKVRKLGKDNLL
jgi:hypothetical protein